MKKVLVLISLLVVAGCDPKDAEVESKPFEQPQNDGFVILDAEPVQFNRLHGFSGKIPKTWPQP